MPRTFQYYGVKLQHLDGNSDSVCSVSSLPLRTDAETQQFLRRWLPPCVLHDSDCAPKGLGKGREIHNIAKTNFGARENWLPHIQKNMNFEVAVLCSLEVIDEDDDIAFSVCFMGKSSVVGMISMMAADVLRRGELEETRRHQADTIEKLGGQIERLEAQRQEVQNVLTEMRTEKEILEARCKRAEDTLSQLSGSGGVSVMAEVELWKQQRAGTIELISHPDLIETVQHALRGQVPTDHHSACAPMRDVIVTSVQAVVNMHLWKQFTLRRQQMQEALARRQHCPWASDVLPESIRLAENISYVSPQVGANEVLLLHGTTEENAMQIVRQGFDERLTHRMLYGRGVYFTTDSCKVMQYFGGSNQ